MKNGLYKISFNTHIGQGTGVVFIHNETIKGGDASMYYTGSFQENNGQVTADIRIGKHSDVPDMHSVFGVDNANVKLQGISTATSATIQGTAAEAPSVTLHASLSLIE